MWVLTQLKALTGLPSYMHFTLIPLAVHLRSYHQSVTLAKIEIVRFPEEKTQGKIHSSSQGRFVNNSYCAALFYVFLADQKFQNRIWIRCIFLENDWKFSVVKLEKDNIVRYADTNDRSGSDNIRLSNWLQKTNSSKKISRDNINFKT